jgi:hypothetical protein
MKLFVGVVVFEKKRFEAIVDGNAYAYAYERPCCFCFMFLSGVIFVKLVNKCTSLVHIMFNIALNH